MGCFFATLSSDALVYKYSSLSFSFWWFMDYEAIFQTNGGKVLVMLAEGDSFIHFPAVPFCVGELVAFCVIIGSVCFAVKYFLENVFRFAGVCFIVKLWSNRK